MFMVLFLSGVMHDGLSMCS